MTIQPKRAVLILAETGAKLTRSLLRVGWFHKLISAVIAGSSEIDAGDFGFGKYAGRCDVSFLGRLLLRALRWSVGRGYAATVRRQGADHFISLHAAVEDLFQAAGRSYPSGKGSSLQD